VTFGLSFDIYRNTKQKTHKKKKLERMVIDLEFRHTWYLFSENGREWLDFNKISCASKWCEE